MFKIAHLMNRTSSLQSVSITIDRSSQSSSLIHIVEKVQEELTVHLSVMSQEELIIALSDIPTSYQKICQLHFLQHKPTIEIMTKLRVKRWIVRKAIHMGYYFLHQHFDTRYYQRLTDYSYNPFDLPKAL